MDPCKFSTCSQSNRLITKLKLKGHENFRSHLFSARNFNGSTHHIHYILRDGHAKASSLNAAYRRRIHTGKRCKNLLQELFIHADTIVFNHKFINGVTRLSRHFLDVHQDDSLFGRVLDCIRNNIQQDLIQAQFIAHDHFIMNIFKFNNKLLPTRANIRKNNSL